MFYKTKITLLNANHELGPVLDFFMYMTLFGVRVLFMEISMHCRSISVSNKGFPGAKPQAIKE